MQFYPVFLSVVFVVRNQSKDLYKILKEAEQTISEIVSDYELIIVDNASTDESVKALKQLTGIDQFANLQVYALTKEVDLDTATWVGMENALGDFVAAVDVNIDDIHYLPTMLEQAEKDADVVFAINEIKPNHGFLYKFAFSSFNFIYKFFNGINLSLEAPQFRILNKRVINFILQHSEPSITYRHLPATGGFTRSYLRYKAEPKSDVTKNLLDSIDRGVRMLVSTTNAPMRLVTLLSLIGAISNLIYSVYVIIIAIFKPDVAAGWVTLSLQQSAMFFLISLVLLVLGEYILNMARLTNEGPLYHVAYEFTSAKMTRHEKLNIEVVDSKSQ
jgi:glycosyltransferase involved in cell wall biosynthesis